MNERDEIAMRFSLAMTLECSSLNDLMSTAYRYADAFLAKRIQEMKKTKCVCIVDGEAVEFLPDMVAMCRRILEWHDRPLGDDVGAVELIADELIPVVERVLGTSGSKQGGQP